MTLVERHKTAMHRTSLSRPVSLALGDGILRVGLSMFDMAAAAEATFAHSARWDMRPTAETLRTGSPSSNGTVRASANGIRCSAPSPATRARYARLVRFTFLILNGRFVTLEP
jgi:hypothetical protein